MDKKIYTRGDAMSHENGVKVTDYWDNESEEVAEVEVWDPDIRQTVVVHAAEVATWLSLRFPGHFLRDGNCTCP